MDTLPVRLKRFGLRVPGILWRRIIAAQARRSGESLRSFGPDHRRVRDFAVTEIVQSAAPVSPERVAAATGIGPDRLGTILDELEGSRTCLYRSDGINVDWAYPVTATATPHRVRLDSGDRFFASSGIDAIAAPFVQGRLTGKPVTAVIGSSCACCERPLELMVDSDLEYRVHTDGAEPLISIPSVNVGRLKDPNIIHTFCRRSLFFWSEEHAAQWGYEVPGVYPNLDQATEITAARQSALFGFPRREP